jgi:thiol-disulfide isomerase/thioredoxin
MFTELEKKQLGKLDKALSREIKIGLAASDHPQTRVFRDFCDNLVQLVPKIKITSEDSSPRQLPQIVIGEGIRYQAVPGGLEMQPFLEALAAMDSGSHQLTESIKAQLEQIDLPATLIAFIAPQCTFCPQVISQLIPLAMANVGVQLIVIDGTFFPEIAQRHRIQSTPTILLDEQFRWTGSIPMEELVEAIRTRDPAMLGATSLESILKDGQAGHLAAMMLDAQMIFPAFYDLLTHEKWPTRLGAMVVMEEIAQNAPGLAAQAATPLWERFEGVADQIKGDILYLFGEIGARLVIPWIDTVIKGEYDDEVKEAAQEALDKISGAI